MLTEKYTRGQESASRGISPRGHPLIRVWPPVSVVGRSAFDLAIWHGTRVDWRVPASTGEYQLALGTYARGLPTIFVYRD